MRKRINKKRYKRKLNERRIGGGREGLKEEN